MMFDEFVIVRFSKVDSQFLANIPDPNPDLALTIDKLNPLNENDFLLYIAPPFNSEEQLINSVDVMFIKSEFLLQILFSNDIAPPVWAWEL